MTGCTYGKGNLVHRDHGKNAYTFVYRSDNKAIHIVTRPEAWPPHHPERERLREKLNADAATDDEQRERYRELGNERALAVLRLHEEKLFEVWSVEVEVPRPARVHNSTACESCGEMVMETRIRRIDGATCAFRVSSGQRSGRQ